MKKLFLVTAIFALLNFGTADAEHANADYYRQIFQSGSFYVKFEYKKDSTDSKNIKWGEKILFADDKNKIRMERTSYKYAKGSLIWLNPLGAIFGGDENKNPEVMYKDGKYYRFFAKNKANVCEEKNLEHENINPRDGWNKIKKILALPDELAVFFWDDPFSLRSTEIPAPIFVESIKKSLDGKEYACDRYETKINDSADLIYELFYNDEGKLSFAKSTLVRNNQEYKINYLEIKEIKTEIADNEKFSYENVQEYPVGMGDIYDLLESSNPKTEAEPIKGEVLQ